MKNIFRNIKSHYGHLCKDYKGEDSSLMIKIGKSRYHHDFKNGILAVEPLLKEILKSDNKHRKATDENKEKITYQH